MTVELLRHCGNQPLALCRAMLMGKKETDPKQWCHREANRKDRTFHTSPNCFVLFHSPRSTVQDSPARNLSEFWVWLLVTAYSCSVQCLVAAAGVAEYDCRGLAVVTKKPPDFRLTAFCANLDRSVTSAQSPRTSDQR